MALALAQEMALALAQEMALALAQEMALALALARELALEQEAEVVLLALLTYPVNLETIGLMELLCLLETFIYIRIILVIKCSFKWVTVIRNNVFYSFYEFV
ncbi:hypothetical protein ATCV1_z412R [Acanthocystis turfacea chlorella virus 1]|uniref:Uncharacterized protein z412R n=1 Tax=Chlorovirus heliozoae TaxID=322019 RepID=A7K922_9PHYC|nr:hypothetical protein ATCV1_z412R [Acanthocystis turfacea chlorella virus 1]ABT16546.1 hypothetical protein ATCV1_z412R [Acanthocystis turfacea chlorella virus 1]